MGIPVPFKGTGVFRGGERGARGAADLRRSATTLVQTITSCTCGKTIGLSILNLIELVLSTGRYLAFTKHFLLTTSTTSHHLLLCRL